MDDYKGINPKLDEVEIAYRLLKMGGQSQNFRELAQDVFEIKGIKDKTPQQMAAFHTQINLDSRFASLGQGNWGLREWGKGKVIRRNISHTSSKGTPFYRRSQENLIIKKAALLKAKKMTPPNGTRSDVEE